MKPNNVEKTFETANDIILADKELEALVRKLVEKTKRRGFSKNAIMRAVSSVWNSNNGKRKELELTENQMEFFSKLKSLFIYYREDLDLLYNEYRHKKSFVSEGDYNWRKKTIGERCYEIVCSLYAVYQKKERVNQKLVIKYLKQYFDAEVTSINSEIQFLYYFMYKRLSFNSKTDLPEVSDKYVLYDNSINWNGEFISFREKYDFSMEKMDETLAAAMWLAETYF